MTNPALSAVGRKVRNPDQRRVARMLAEETEEPVREIVAARLRTINECLEFLREGDLPACTYRLKRGVERQARLAGLIPREGVLP